MTYEEHPTLPRPQAQFGSASRIFQPQMVAPPLCLQPDSPENEENTKQRATKKK
eukprot:CAMPEP_0195608370 /NCGR_PEP_ID=MMETSP0815-20121206/8707_1 /TAXON_ID=97485 /ORGANISM="Prymnesium parvum, Strain Texoma1" /LENGTH=53 /DNA_ID=CAMNT_0040748223 /DNA_START=72 /DNA_END=233 /DNA_ORIENTATION=-